MLSWPYEKYIGEQIKNIFRQQRVWIRKSKFGTEVQFININSSLVKPFDSSPYNN